MEFYLYLNGERRGPFSEERVQSYVADGLLQPSDLASDQADSGWKALASFTRFSFAPATQPRVEMAAPAMVAPTAPAVPLRPHPERPRLPNESLGPYARATLAPDETPYFKTSLHWIIFVRFAILALLAFLLLAMPFAIGVQALIGSQLGWFALPLPAFIMIPPTLAWVSSELVITDRRVLIKTGIVRRETLEMFISKVESIAIDQGFLGRILDYGRVTIRGTGGLEEPFDAIANPLEFRNWVQRLQHGNDASSAG